MKKFLIITLSIIFLSLSNTCAFAKKTTGLAQRQIQTRVYDTADVEHVMKAVANTLQDSDFIIEEVENEIG